MLSINMRNLDRHDSEPTADGNLIERAQGTGLTLKLVDRLTEKIRLGHIRSGEKLPPEMEIMRTFGVSRSVVREALQRLIAAGLVRTQHGVGTFAIEVDPSCPSRFGFPAQIDLSAMFEMLELRTSVESDAAAFSAVRRTDEHLNELRQALADFNNHARVVRATVEPDFRFHLTIAVSTGNRYYTELMKKLGSAVIPATRVSSSRLAPEASKNHLMRVNQEHQDIFDAIEQKDPEAARAAMRLHLMNSRERQRLAHLT